MRDKRSDEIYITSKISLQKLSIPYRMDNPCVKPANLPGKGLNREILDLFQH